MTIRLNSTALNVLRVYATLMVFFCHSTIVSKEVFEFQLHGVMRAFNTPAWGGVWMFFAMGGFLAAYGFDKKHYTIDREGILFYYKTRFVKVLLPTWIFISMAYIFSMNESTLSWTTILQLLTCTFNGGGAGVKNIGASWYVFITMWLYLLAPLIFKVLINYEHKAYGCEMKSYLKLVTAIVCISLGYKLGGGILLKLDYYTWMYANVLGSVDIFVVGMIGCRLLNYIPKDIDIRKIKTMRIIALMVLFFISIVFSGLLNELAVISSIFTLFYKGFSFLYYYVGSWIFTLTAISLILLYSYREDESEKKCVCLKRKLGEICNTLSPYTFMFYLWHTIILTKVANKIVLEDMIHHYFAMLTIGFIVISYIAYLFTNMNNGIIKSILRK